VKEHRNNNIVDQQEPPPKKQKQSINKRKQKVQTIISPKGIDPRSTRK
jgi:hypothetical protein